MEYITCFDCGGCGECSTSHTWTCYTCHGAGKITKEKHDQLMKEKTEKEERKGREDYISDNLWAMGDGAIENITKIVKRGVARWNKKNPSKEVADDWC